MSSKPTQVMSLTEMLVELCSGSRSVVKFGKEWNRPNLAVEVEREIGGVDFAASCSMPLDGIGCDDDALRAMLAAMVRSRRRAVLRCGHEETKADVGLTETTSLSADPCSG